MDQESNDKARNKGWREKLGINKDLPKLSGNFDSPRREPRVEREARSEKAGRERAGASSSRSVERQRDLMQKESRQAAGKPPPSVGQPVRRLAPMAPRPSSTSRPAAPSKRPMAPRPQPDSGVRKTSPTRPTAFTPTVRPPSSTRPSSANTKRVDDFSERLRIQREAAEKLVKQRMGTTAPASERGEKPRFTFADEEIKAAQREDFKSPEKPVQPRQAEPLPEHLAAKAAAVPPASQIARESYVPPASQHEQYEPRYADDGAATPVEAGYDYNAQPDDDDYYHRERHQESHLPPPVAPPTYQRTQYADDHLDDDMPLRTPVAPGQETLPRPAGPEDYSSAFQNEDGYMAEPPQRRGIGMMLLLLAIFAVVVIAGGLIYYRGQMLSNTGSSGGEIPVISAPEKPIKTEPAPINDDKTGQPRGRKQIYDRILGEETLEPERIVPTEEKPQQPGTEQSGTPLPLPLPPPGAGDQQSSLQNHNNPSTKQEMQAQGSALSDSGPDPGRAQNQHVVAEPASQTVTAKSNSRSIASAESGLPVPSSSSDNNVFVKTDNANNATIVAPLPMAKPQSLARQIRARKQREAKQRRVPKQVARAKSTPQIVQPAQPSQGTGQGPVVLTTLQQPQQNKGILSNILPSLGGGQATTRGLGGKSSEDRAGSGTAVNSFATPVPQQQITPQQQAAIAPTPAPTKPIVAAPAPAPVQKVVKAGGYMVQLPAYKTEGEALNEFQRIKGRNPSLLRGLGSQIRPISLGATGKLYALTVGPVKNRSTAVRLCNSLISAGEKDCFVRGN